RAEPDGGRAARRRRPAGAASRVTVHGRRDGVDGPLPARAGTVLRGGGRPRARPGGDGAGGSARPGAVARGRAIRRRTPARRARGSTAAPSSSTSTRRRVGSPCRSSGRTRDGEGGGTPVRTNRRRPRFEGSRRGRHGPATVSGEPRPTRFDGATGSESREGRAVATIHESGDLAAGRRR